MSNTNSSKQDSLGLVLILAVTTLIGASIRLFFVLSNDFPINDGGLFYQMARDLVENGFRLPAYTSYNLLQIPFAYSPLSFYLVGLIHHFTGIDMLTAVRFLPVAFNILTIPAFFLLCRALIGDSFALIFATLIYAILPPGYQWFIMGGGVARAPGMFFSLLALWLVIRGMKNHDHSRRDWAIAGIFAGLTALSHLEIFFVTCIWIAIAALVFLDFRKAIAITLVIGLISAAVAAPWWLTVVVRHGLAPFLSAFKTGGFNLGQSLLTLFLGGLGGEYLITPALVFGLLGLVRKIQQRDWLLPLWFASIAIFDTRSLGRSLFTPLCILAGIFILEVILPALSLLADQIQSRKKYLSNTFGLLFIIYLLLRAGVTTQMMALGSTPEMHVLSQSDRQAAVWIKENISATSRFIILTSPIKWFNNHVAEWFPALAERRSINTVQGTEWLANQGFTKQQTIYDGFQACALYGIECVEDQAEKTGQEFDYIYLSGRLEDTVSGYRSALPIEAELCASSKYTLVYSDGEVLIFRKN